MSLSKSAATDRPEPAPKHAIALLKADHEAAKQLFAEYEKSRSIST